MVRQAILKYLADPFLTYREIADMPDVGCSRERVRQIAASDQRVKPLADKRRVRGQAREMLLKSQRPDPETPLGRVWTEAESRGFKCERLIIDPRTGTLQSGGLLVNGHHVRVTYSTTVQKSGTREYRKFTMPASPNAEFYACIDCRECWRVFILPLKIIIDNHSGRSGHVSIYIPMDLDAPVYRNHPSRIKWRKYLDAWEQLR